MPTQYGSRCRCGRTTIRVAHTIAGVLRDTATVELALPAGIDPARSRLSLNLGTTPLATIRGIQQSLRDLPILLQRAAVEHRGADRCAVPRTTADGWRRERGVSAARSRALSSC